MPHGTEWLQLAGWIAVAYVFFRGVCVCINNACVWILTKFGAEEKV